MSMSAMERDRVIQVIETLPPGLAESKDHPELMGKVQVTLDGEDVTARCRAFSLDPGLVVLYVLNERGRKAMESVCGCGPGPYSRLLPVAVCSRCGETVTTRAKTEERRGAVEVTPL